jgi:hypothetical protein
MRNSTLASRQLPLDELWALSLSKRHRLIGHPAVIHLQHAPLTRWTHLSRSDYEQVDSSGIGSPHKR